MFQRRKSLPHLAGLLIRPNTVGAGAVRSPRTFSIPPTTTSGCWPETWNYAAGQIRATSTGDRTSGRLELTRRYRAVKRSNRRLRRRSGGLGKEVLDDSKQINHSHYLSKCKSLMISLRLYFIRVNLLSPDSSPNQQLHVQPE